ncbi:MAG: HprK-related kinase A [Burkholderiaceae bacterium]|nr:HprK-related kinase A [Burkholderiaceae bacterium]
MSQSLRDVEPGVLRQALAADGVRLDFGAARLRLSSTSRALANHLRLAYANFPLDVEPSWSDIHARISPVRGIRRWIRPQVAFHCDGTRPFEPFPADAGLPLLEWGTNWLFSQRLNELLLFHAGVVERDGRALLMPAMPGSGKSTLTAGLSVRGWRLLSDEFGAWDLQLREFHPVLKPIALKNESIAVIRRFAPEAQFGPSFPGTRKGTVSHLAANSDAVARRHDRAKPGAIVLPKWVSGAHIQLDPLGPDRAFPLLAFNSFNYTTLGEAAFDAVVRLARGCPAYSLIYANLDEAVALLSEKWPTLIERAGE